MSEQPDFAPLWPAGHLPHTGGDQPVAKADEGLISPRVGEMAGRPEGGKVGRGWFRHLATMALACLGGLLATPALAHLDPGEHGSFAAGFSHPLFGTDHILAMVAVGLWAALLAQSHDRRAVWLVPSAFVVTMLVGFLAAMAGAPLPFVEPVILASVVVIGLLAAIALNVPAPVAMALVGFFAVFHGHAHGGEIGEAGAGFYALGFAIATALLHAAGVALGLGFGLVFGGITGRMVTRAAGALAALGGVWLAIGG